MTMDPIDPNLPPKDPYVRRPLAESRGMGWGVPAVIAAFAIIAGLLLYNSTSDRTTTASNDAPVTRQTNPSTPPVPAPTPPAKIQ